MLLFALNTGLKMNTALKYNIYQQHCPARLFFEKIADKWVLLIINVLADETQLQSFKEKYSRYFT
jgi:DNA-binding HxlR family transcriptional regulator